MTLEVVREAGYVLSTGFGGGGGGEVLEEARSTTSCWNKYHLSFEVDAYEVRNAQGRLMHMSSIGTLNTRALYTRA